MLDLESKKIICTAFTQGKTHDFTLFKNSKTHKNKEIECLVDKGDQGIKKIPENRQLPKKKPKNGQLSKSKREIEISPLNEWLLNM